MKHCNYAKLMSEMLTLLILLGFCRSSFAGDQISMIQYELSFNNKQSISHLYLGWRPSFVAYDTTQGLAHHMPRIPLYSTNKQEFTLLNYSSSGGIVAGLTVVGTLVGAMIQVKKDYDKRSEELATIAGQNAIIAIENSGIDLDQLLDDLENLDPSTLKPTPKKQ